jgi:hypothetical protein
VRLAVPVLAAALVVAASGCGGDGEDAAGTTTGAAAISAPATTAEDYQTRPTAPADQTRWASQVDAACAPWQEQIDAVAPPADATALARWLDDTLPLVRKQVAAVEAVKPPAKAEEAERAALFVAGLRKIERSLTRYRAAIETSDEEAVTKALADANAAGAETRAYALSLDVTECGGYSGG